MMQKNLKPIPTILLKLLPLIERKYYNNSMSFGEDLVSISTDVSFADVIDETCDRLMDRQIQFSIRKIHEMEESLSALEQELNEIILARSGS